MVWSKEAVATLKDCAAKGMSGTEIGDVLNVSRNAVIGKLHRLGLVKSPQTAKDAQSHKGAIRRPGARDAGNKPMAIARHATTFSQKRNATAAAQAPEAELTLEERISLEPDESADAVSLLEAKDDTCRWPIESSGAMLFCGAPGYPYCARHQRRSVK